MCLGNEPDRRDRRAVFLTAQLGTACKTAVPKRHDRSWAVRATRRIRDWPTWFGRNPSSPPITKNSSAPAEHLADGAKACGMATRRAPAFVRARFRNGRCRQRRARIHITLRTWPGRRAPRGRTTEPAVRCWAGPDGDGRAVRQHQGEPVVAVVDGVVDRRRTRAVAEAYLDFLYTPEMQDVAARHGFRPSNPAVAERFAAQFPPIEMFTVDDMFGGWARVQDVHFGEGGVFDQIYTPGR